MIYAELLGGIGNISFIVATAYTLALDNHDEATFSTTLNSITHRRNEAWWFKTYFRKIKRGNPKIKMTYKEPGYTYKKIPYYPSMKIHGYFQSSKYFDHRRQDILELFTDYKNDILNNLLLKLDLLPGRKISLHIRRTDYIKLQHAHTLLPMKYYQNAVAKLKEKIGKDYNDFIYIIFSDDTDWCKKQPFLNSLPDVQFIEDSDALTKGPVEVFQLYLMSMCEHNIIANSSFSWWGAYLNENPKQIVIAPSKWYNSGGPKNWSTVYCDKWIKCPIQ